MQHLSPSLVQLPPVVQNMAFQKYSNMEQSMFARFVRLRVPTVQLDAQGRARPALCQLYNWRSVCVCVEMFRQKVLRRGLLMLGSSLGFSNGCF